MFSALRHGNIVYIIDKTDGLILKKGQVVSNSATNMPYNLNPNSLLTLTIDIESETKEFNNIPAMQSSINYNNGKLIIIDNQELASTELENIVKSSKDILDNREYYEKLVSDGEEALKSINPQFAKDKARDDEFNALKEQVGGMENKLNTIIDLLNKTGN